MPLKTEKAKNAEKKSHYVLGTFEKNTAPKPVKGEPAAVKTTADDLRAGKKKR